MDSTDAFVMISCVAIGFSLGVLNCVYVIIHIKNWLEYEKPKNDANTSHPFESNDQNSSCDEISSTEHDCNTNKPADPDFCLMENIQTNIPIKRTHVSTSTIRPTNKYMLVDDIGKSQTCPNISKIDYSHMSYDGL